MSQVFSIIELLLILFGVRSSFLDYLNAKDIARAAEKSAARDKAVDESKTAGTDDEIWKSQDDITNNKP